MNSLAQQLIETEKELESAKKAIRRLETRVRHAEAKAEEEERRAVLASGEREVAMLRAIQWENRLRDYQRAMS